jgi:hypothetical protein
MIKKMENLDCLGTTVKNKNCIQEEINSWLLSGNSSCDADENLLFSGQTN